MHKFIERYADSIKDSDAVKLILHEVKEAYEDCKDEDKSYIEHLEKADAMISALWYWNKRNLKKYADVGDLKGATRVINGGYNGLADRQQKYDKYLKEF